MADPVTQALDKFAARNDAESLGTYGIVVDLAGHPPIERRFRSDDRVNLYSVAKGFTALAIGWAISEGRISLDDLLLDAFPERRQTAAPGLEQVTLRHLLTMTSGSPMQWYAHQPVPSGDLLGDYLAQAPEHPAGEHFAYTDIGPYLAGRMLARATGADLRSYLTPRLFDPLAIHNPQWHTCPAGHPFAASDLFLSTEELSRCARVFRDRGRWHDQQLVPEGWIETISRITIPTASLPYGDYGIGVWGCPARIAGFDDVYRLHGAYGQFAIIASDRVAVTVTAHCDHDWDLLTALMETVVAPLYVPAQ